jgi:hypothetical protein
LRFMGHARPIRLKAPMRQARGETET